MFDKLIVGLSKYIYWLFFPNQVKDQVSNVRHHISALRTPVRRNLVPGVQGERLAHSLDVNRPLPYKEIERLLTEQIVRSLPYRLSFHTGSDINIFDHWAFVHARGDRGDFGVEDGEEGWGGAGWCTTPTRQRNASIHYYSKTCYPGWSLSTGCLIFNRSKWMG